MLTASVGAGVLAGVAIAVVMVTSGEQPTTTAEPRRQLVVRVPKAPEAAEQSTVQVPVLPEPPMSMPTPPAHTKAAAPPRNDISDIPGLVLWWPLDETTGTTAKDRGPNHIDGRLENCRFEDISVPGRYGRAVSLTGSARIVARVDREMAEHSVAFWVYKQQITNASLAQLDSVRDEVRDGSSSSKSA